jgi:hypothetical protein
MSPKGQLPDQKQKFSSLKCSPQSRRSDRPSPDFIANADSIREHR